MPRKYRYDRTRVVDLRSATRSVNVERTDWTPIRNKGYKGQQRHNGINTLRGAPFIAWDGEGTAVDKLNIIDPIGERLTKGEAKAQPFVLLAYHTGIKDEGDYISSEYGLSTQRCFEFILNVKQRYLRSIFVGYGLGYDFNQILCDLPPSCRRQLMENHETKWDGYYIKWIPGKWLNVFRTKRRSFIMYDAISFFAQPFLETCKEYLGTDDPDLGIIEEGKKHRTEFTWQELDKFIIPYNNMELRMHVRIMNELRRQLASINVHPDKWYGPGAVASKVLSINKVKVCRDIPQEVVDAGQYGYAGGRFEQFWMGCYPDTVYEYDIHSAYPAEAIGLPDLNKGSWEHVSGYEPGSFGIWRVEYRAPDGTGKYRPQPLFCRAEDGRISYPCEVHGWYWTPEADLVPGSVREGYVFRPTTSDQPFAFVESLYEQRQLLKDQKDPAQRAIKIILASLYGKLAQTVGGKGEPPKWHQLEWAGWITSATRAKIYKAIMLNPNAIIATETDAVFSKVPLDLTLSDSLGDWEPKKHDGIIYLQSGFYYAGKEGIVCKYRGMDRDRETEQPVGLPYREVLDHFRFRPLTRKGYTPPLHASSTRFVGLAAGLITKATWRSWETTPRPLSIDGDRWRSKRFHLREECPTCQHAVDTGGTIGDGLHPLQIGGHSGESFPRRLPWIERPPDAKVIDWNTWLEERGMADLYQSKLDRLEMEKWDG